MKHRQRMRRKEVVNMFGVIEFQGEDYKLMEIEEGHNLDGERQHIYKLLRLSDGEVLEMTYTKK
jgi:hypothetical protein